MLRLLLGLALLGIVLWPLEQFFPSVRGKKVVRRGFYVDLIYWFFTPTVTATLTFGVMVVTAVVLIVASGGEIRQSNLLSGRAPVTELPVALQYLAVLVLADFLGYVAHRLFHQQPFWPFHAVHHSSQDLDWLSAVRLHPVNQALAQGMIVAPLALLGFNLQVLSVTSGVFTFWAIFVHSNVRWTFGPLRHIITTPAFHRWHHTSQAEGLDRNFAGLFVFWDRLFGTLYLPEGVQAERFGVEGELVPRTFLGQLSWPFRAALRSGLPGRLV